MKVTNFAQLMSGEPRAEIRCLYTGKLVRVLTVSPDSRTVEIDAQDGGRTVVTVPITTPITYEPWAMDRGNMLFPAAAVIDPPPAIADLVANDPRQVLKICGEGDPIAYASGETATVNPDHLSEVA